MSAAGADRHDRVAALRDNARLITRRVALARTRGRLAYIGAEGDGNLGDDAMFEAAKCLFPGRALASFSNPRHERRLAALRLSGPRYFDGAILGGGTLINEHFLERARAAVEMGVPTVALGTGVGSTGFGMGEDADTRGWQSVLASFRQVGVRGERSRRKLEALDVRSQVVGDLALALAQEQVLPPAEPPAVVVNVSRPGPDHVTDRDYDQILTGVVNGLQPLIDAGWVVVPVAMTNEDVQGLREVTRRCGLPDQINGPRSSSAFFTLVGRARFVVAVRLHAAVLACCAGVPPLMLSYREKCLDFMETVGLEHLALDLDVAGADAIADGIHRVADESVALRGTMLPSVHGLRAELRRSATLGFGG